MSTESELTATSYAILGLLAIKPWTTYELTQQMDRGMSRFWPRAASKLYEEPKKLVSRGFARKAEETMGRRRRTLYSITPKGRRALGAWAARPGAGPHLEFEALLKVFFAENGSKADLLASLEAARTWADERAAENIAIAKGYLAGEGPFPERSAHTLLVGRFLADFEDMVRNWAIWASGVVDAWPADISAAPADGTTLKRLAERAP
ncbi:MAG: PadR family transcriptional regulator [Candidatus Dormibacteria bacterium]